MAKALLNVSLYLKDLQLFNHPQLLLIQNKQANKQCSWYYYTCIDQKGFLCWPREVGFTRSISQEKKLDALRFVWYTPCVPFGDASTKMFYTGNTKVSFLCPPMPMEGSQERGENQLFLPQRSRHGDYMIQDIALLPLPMTWPTLLAAPLMKHWKEPRSR